MTTTDIRLVTSADMDVVVSILDEAAGWLHGREIQQWPRHFAAEQIAPAVDRGSPCATAFR